MAVSSIYDRALRVIGQDLSDINPETVEITLEGDANGAPHPAPAAYAAKFSGEYTHRTVTGGIGHNLPQEAPQAFAAAIMDVGAL